MERTLVGRGSRGGIVKNVQDILQRLGFYTGKVDGMYGGVTERAVTFFQDDNQLEETGAIGQLTWVPLMKRPVPSVFERCLQLTAAFEGHGFGVIAGNWDGAWATWGIIGFTLRHREINAIVLEVFEKNPETVREAFGNLTDELIHMMQAPSSEQEAWANRISEGSNKVKVIEPWRSAFMRFGDRETVQVVQIRRARERYFSPATDAASQYKLQSEQGIALCFDIWVQNGGIGPDAERTIQESITSNPPDNEQALRIVIANAVADNAKPQYREDVRKRKLTIATGAGGVHGEHFELDNWGIGEFPTDV